MRPDELASLVPGRLGNFEHALFIGGVSGSLTAHVANSINGDLTVCDFDNARLSELKQLQGLSKPISLRHVLPVPAESTDIAKAYSCSEATHSSLAHPSMIREKMPGLTFSETSVSTSSVDELVSEMGLNDARSNLLVISVTGFEALWLDLEAGLLRYFDTVLVRLPLAGWFDTAVQGDQLLSNLALPGIALPFGSLPYRWWMIRRSVGWGAQQRATEEASSKFLEKVEELEQAKERTAALEAKLSDQTETADALKESLASKDAELKQAINRLLALENDLSSALGQVDAHVTKVTSLQSDLANSLDAHSSLESELSGSHQTIDDLKAELEQQTKWHHDNKHWAEALKQELDNKSAALEEAEARESALNEVLKTHDVTIANLQSAVSDKQSRIDSLERDQRELEYCQKTLDDEIVKAEAQLELIKDVVLRDKAF